MVRTVCGSFICEQKSHKILGGNGVVENIYTFSGNYKAIYSRSKDRKLNIREFLFAKYIMLNFDITSAYKKAFTKATNERYIRKKSHDLLKTERIRKIIDTEVMPFFKKPKPKEVNEIKKKTSYVYFIQQNNKLKIGKSVNPKKRMKTFQTGSPYKLKLLGFFKGSYSAEDKVFEDLKEYHVRGEWYEYCDEVCDYIKKYNEWGGCDI